MPLPLSFWTRKSARIQTRSQWRRLRSPRSYIRAAIQTPLREVLRPLPALGPRRLHLYLPQKNWSADKRKTSRLNPMGNKPARRSRPSEAVRSRTDFFFSPSSRFLPQVPQARGPLHQFPDVRAAVLLDSEPGEFLYVTSQRNSCMSQ